MYERHFNRELYFKEQSRITQQIILPYIARNLSVTSDSFVLEIGCSDAGNLHPFLEMGCKVTGIDISEIRINNASGIYASYPLKKNITLIASDIFDVKTEQTGKFDLIIIVDTLEHIQNQEKLLAHIKQFLKPEGRIFVGFPPWRMPFGGHQQMCKSRFLSKVPYFHLLPKPFFTFILKLFGEEQYRIEELLTIGDTRIGVQTFKEIVIKNKYRIECEDFYFINPAYKIKFNLKARKLPRFLNIPYLRDYFTTACYYILSCKI
jgi:SAM-dependent methyltransferase